ncbi:hypothetical protein AB0M47_26245 [Hamadaea sp. NPDC051192]|uniref:hypothetical protein n=1 Tax=Hamadaea sp. NPDC051192 TaxID=3154940 RepID=UPI0034330523
MTEIDQRNPPIARMRPGGRADGMPPRMRRAGDRQSRGRGTPPLREWHQLTAVERKTAWVELVEWAIWLHDRYELSRDSRLPDCWPQHPGLVEELWTLKAWREEIYTATEPSAQAARYWHAELRQVVQAAKTFYAPGCRAGHKATPKLAATDVELRTVWLGGDPLLGVPPSMLTASGTTNGDVLADSIIRDALQRGDARTLSETVCEWVRYREHWWALHDGRWVRVDDPLTVAMLDAKAEELAAFDQAAARFRL